VEKLLLRFERDCLLVNRKSNLTERERESKEFPWTVSEESLRSAAEGVPVWEAYNTPRIFFFVLLAYVKVVPKLIRSWEISEKEWKCDFVCECREWMCRGNEEELWGGRLETKKNSEEEESEAAVVMAVSPLHKSLFVVIFLGVSFLMITQLSVHQSQQQQVSTIITNCIQWSSFEVKYKARLNEWILCCLLVRTLLWAPMLEQQTSKNFWQAGQSLYELMIVLWTIFLAVFSSRFEVTLVSARHSVSAKFSHIYSFWII